MTREEWSAFKAAHFNNGAGEINEETLNQLIEFIENTPKDDEEEFLNELLNFSHHIFGNEDGGIVGIVSEIEGAYFLGLHGESGTFLDANGNYYHLDSGSLVLRSNIEAGITTKFIIMPYLDDINYLTGYGMSSGFDISGDGILSGGINIGLASYNLESFNISVYGGIGFQIIPIGDVYLNLSITEINEGLTQEELEELLERVDNMELGGY